MRGLPLSVSVSDQYTLSESPDPRSTRQNPFASASPLLFLSPAIFLEGILALLQPQLR
jgi:hypothetical protein